MRTESQKIYERACKVLPGGVNSPVRSFPGLNLTPLIAERGEGDRVYDEDGHCYIDYCGSWGALIHGHAHPEIVTAAGAQAAKGCSFGMTTLVETEFAELLARHLPSIEKIRFVSSGTEATMSSVRLARGFTGRKGVVKFSGNYHGHADPFLVQAGSGVAELAAASSAGVPEVSVQHTHSLPFNDLEALRDFFRREGKGVAAVIVEPVAANMGVVLPKRDFLNGLREECDKQGALLIFDEVITGFRLGFEGGAGYFGVTPDLSCFGKILGGGFPAAAFGGKKEIMDFLAPLGPIYQAGTLSGNPVAMQAGLRSVALCQRDGFYQTLQDKTQLITQPVQKFIKERDLPVCLNSIGSLFTLFFGQREVSSFEDAKKCDSSRFPHFFHTLFQKGIYFAPSQFEANFVSQAHTEESLMYTRDTLLEYLDAAY